MQNSQNYSYSYTLFLVKLIYVFVCLTHIWYLLSICKYTRSMEPSLLQPAFGSQYWLFEYY